MNKALFLLTVLSCLAVNAFAFSVYQQEVSIYPQPDSPLLLSNPVPGWRVSIPPDGEKVNMLSVNFISQNLSDKVIYAYTIRFFDGEFDGSAGATMFTYSDMASVLFQPSQAKNEEAGEFGFGSPLKPKNVKIAVDFIAFTDGSTWGKDKSDSASYLAGTRAGIEAFQKYLLDVNRQNGMTAVIKALDETPQLQPSENQNDRWKTGFQRGTSIKKYRFRSIYKKDGLKAIEEALKSAPYPEPLK